MITGLGSSLSALDAFQTKLDKTAENLANIGTDGYKAKRVLLADNGNGGVAARVERDQEKGPVALEVTGGKETAVEKSNVNLASEMTDLLATKTAFKANLKALEAADELVGALLDIKK